MLCLYGKNNNILFEQKKSFLNPSSRLFDEQRRIAELYRNQPPRLNCKNCRNTLAKDVDMNVFGIDYKFCSECSHFNGCHQDTLEFCKKIYVDEMNGVDYSSMYDVGDDTCNYDQRVNSIYFPKAQYLFSSLKNCKEIPSNLSYHDFGCGSGYFVEALRRLGIEKVSGSDVSQRQVEYGNRFLPGNILSTHGFDNTVRYLESMSAEVVSMIGVLEGLQDPILALKAIRDNDNIRYLFLSVPLVSVSMFFSVFSDDLYHRQLTSGHTHLYTEESLIHLVEHSRGEILNQWWFGGDIFDLYRHIYINMKRKNFSEKATDYFDQAIKPALDALQIELDKKHLSSEVHMLVKMF